MVEHCQNLSKNLAERFGVTHNDYVVDVGSNDGTFLQFVRDGGANVLGVEPTNKPCAIANSRGIKTLNCRFEDSASAVLTETCGRLRLLTALSVIAHTDTIHDFLDRVVEVISPSNAIFVSRVPYLPSLIQHCEYDTVYHEHARYFTLSAQRNLFRMHGLSIFDAELSPLYGGSIITYAMTGTTKEQAGVERLLVSEEEFRSLKPYASFAERVLDSRQKLLSLLSDAKKSGHSIVGIGAPMKSSTLLNFCGIGPETLDYLTEVNPLKIGTYTPGSAIRVLDESTMFRHPPDDVMLLAWNASDAIIRKFKARGFGGRFLVPIPDPRWVV